MRKFEPVEQVAQRIYRKGKRATSLREIQDAFVMPERQPFDDDLVEAVIKLIFDLAND